MPRHPSYFGLSERDDNNNDDNSSVSVKNVLFETEDIKECLVLEDLSSDRP